MCIAFYQVQDDKPLPQQVCNLYFRIGETEEGEGSEYKAQAEVKKNYHHILLYSVLRLRECLCTD